jgi:hypothetical protein
MSRWHDDDHAAEPETSRKLSPADEMDERLKRLAREAKEAELAHQLTKEAQGWRKGKGDGR